MPPTLYLADGHALAYRTYFALSSTGGGRWHTSGGEPTACVYGFASVLMRLLKNEKPDYIAVAYDTGQTFRDEIFPEECNAKRAYYLSLEFLMGRALANNITNLMLDPVLGHFCKKHKIDPLEIIEQEPDAGLGNGGLGRLAACFLDSMATLGIPGMGCGLRYEYGIFKQTIRDGWQCEQPDHWLARHDPWEVARPEQCVEVHLGCSFDIRGGALCVARNQPTTLYGIPYDRPVVGYGGKTVNTLRLWAAATPHYFDFQQFSSGDFVGALAETLTAETGAGGAPRRSKKARMAPASNPRARI